MATDKIKLSVIKRDLTGRKVKKLRREGVLPGNIYGKDVKSLAVQVPAKDFKAAFDQAGETGIIELKVDKETKARPALIHNVHLHPVTDELLHVDFHQVDLTKKVTVDIPIELTGEAPGVNKGGVLVQVLDEIEVEALPTDLPDKFVLDVSTLEEIGQGLTLKDIKVDAAKVKLVTENPEEIVVQIEEPAKEEEKPVEAAPAEGEAAAEAETAPAEGEAEKEGEKKEEENPADKPKPEPKKEK